MEEAVQLEMFGPNTDMVANKLVVLCLIDKMDIPLTNVQISQFVLEENCMTYYELQETLNEMVEDGYLERNHVANGIRFSITNEGITTLEYFEKRIPGDIRHNIGKFVSQNRKTIKKDFETIANYFYEHASDEFIVKCGIYEDERVLMEINISVVNREQAKLICNNWKRSVSQMYKNIITELVTTYPQDESDEDSSV